MKKIYTVLLSSLFLMACGGGGDKDSSTNDKYLGVWLTSCEVYGDGASSRSSLSFANEDGFEILAFAEAEFQTSNCTGTAEIYALAGEVKYPGQTVTSICTADNFDLNIEFATTDGVTEITGSNLQLFLSQEGIPNPIFDIVCNYDGQLLLGEETSTLDSSSSTRRPVDVDVSQPFYLDDSVAAKGINNKSFTSEELLKSVFNKVKNKL